MITVGPEFEGYTLTLTPPGSDDASRGLCQSRSRKLPAQRLSDLAGRITLRLTGEPSLLLTPYEGICLVHELTLLGQEVNEMQRAASLPRGILARLAAFIRRRS